MFGSEFQARKIYKVPAATFKGRSPIEAMGTLGTLGNGFQASYRIMGEAMPRAIIGFGGYPTLAPLLAAIGRGIPSAIHEQNAVMGQANRFLAPMVKAIACSFENTRYLEGKLLPKARITGTPLQRLGPRAPQHSIPSAVERGSAQSSRVRRQPGRQIFLRYRAAGAADAVRLECATGCS